MLLFLMYPKLKVTFFVCFFLSFDQQDQKTLNFGLGASREKMSMKEQGGPQVQLATHPDPKTKESKEKEAEKEVEKGTQSSPTATHCSDQIRLPKGKEKAPPSQPDPNRDINEDEPPSALPLLWLTSESFQPRDADEGPSREQRHPSDFLPPSERKQGEGHEVSAHEQDEEKDSEDEKHSKGSPTWILSQNPLSLPPLCQLDLHVLLELPEEQKNEILRAYAAQQPSSMVTSSFLPSADSKGGSKKRKIPFHPPPGKRRGRPPKRDVPNPGTASPPNEIHADNHYHKFPSLSQVFFFFSLSLFHLFSSLA